MVLPYVVLAPYYRRKLRDPYQATETQAAERTLLDFNCMRLKSEQTLQSQAATAHHAINLMRR